MDCTHTHDKPSRKLIAFQIFLLVLIVIGIGLLYTQEQWVPTVVDFLLAHPIV